MTTWTADQFLADRRRRDDRVRQVERWRLKAAELRALARSLRVFGSGPKYAPHLAPRFDRAAARLEAKVAAGPDGLPALERELLRGTPTFDALGRALRPIGIMSSAAGLPRVSVTMRGLRS